MNGRRKAFISVAAVATLIAVLVLWVQYGEFWQIDGCLDSGGAWNYTSKECEH
ncbi:MAG: hypothetical protein ACJ8E3_03245 [Sphingomicrobium sp.]